MRKLDLDKLKLGQPGMSPAVGAFLREGAIFCLESNGHKSGVTLIIEGDFNERLQLVWSNDNIDIQASWKDKMEATEHGAAGIAALLIDYFTDYTIIGRATIGTGVDYELGRKNVDNLLDMEAFLEVSGIWYENLLNTVNIRINRKIRQVEKGERARQFFSYIVVTEFGKPQSKIVKK